MFEDVLNQITDAESKAEQMGKDAKAEAAQILKNARKESVDLVKKAELRGRKVYDSFVSQGTAESEVAYERSMNDAEETGKRILAVAKPAMDDAVNLIKERIVKFSVDN